MKTINFFSYKDTGRKIEALVKVAKNLALKGNKVCVIDFDLEAPVLNHYLDSSIEIGLGLVDYMDYFFIESKETAFAPNIKDYVVKIDGMPLTYMAAGDSSKNAYWVKNSALVWDTIFYSGKKYGVSFFIEFKERIKQALQCDYLLLNSQSGLSHVSGITSCILSEQSFVFGGSGDAHTEGALLFLENLKRKGGHILDIVPKTHYVLLRDYAVSKKKDIIKDEKELVELMGEYLNTEILVLHKDLNIDALIQRI